MFKAAQHRGLASAFKAHSSHLPLPPFPSEPQRHAGQSSGGLRCPGERVHSEHLVFAFKIMFYGPLNGAPNTVLLCLLRKPDSDFWFVKFMLARKVLLLILVGHLGFRF